MYGTANVGIYFELTKKISQALDVTWKVTWKMT